MYMIVYVETQNLRTKRAPNQYKLRTACSLLSFAFATGFETIQMIYYMLAEVRKTRAKQD